MNPPGYTKPAKSHFAHYVVRMMTKAIATHTIGMDGFAMVCIVGHQWDTIRYSRPVSYSNAVLMHLLGLNSKCTLYRIERKCIAAGWLKKHSLGKRKNPVYWVDLPDHARLLPDTVTDDFEGDDDTKDDTQTGLEGDSGAIGVRICTIRDTKTGLEAILKQDSINPLPFPSPSPNSSKRGEGESQDLFDGKTPEPTPDRELIRGLVEHVRWRVQDKDGTDDNVAELASLIRRHTLPVVQEAALACFEAAGREKVWPDVVSQHLAGQDGTEAPQDDFNRPLPPVCQQAIAAVRSLGFTVAHTACPQIDPTGDSADDLARLIRLYESGNQPAAQELLDAIEKTKP